MKRSLLRSFSFYAHHRLLYPSTSTSTSSYSNSSLVQLAASTRCRLSFYSSETSNSSRNPKKDDTSDNLNDDVSNEELKKRIEKYFEGDEEAIPSIFEAILQRKLVGLVSKHDNNDDNELVEQLCRKSQLGREPESDYEK